MSLFYQFEVCNSGNWITSGKDVQYKHVGASIALTNKAKRPKGFSLVTWLTGHSPEEYRQRLYNA